jgi:hypothetical protein
MVDIIERRSKEAFLDSLFVMEEGMRHYFSKAMQAKLNNMKAEIVDRNMQKAIEVAEKVAPYRHAFLSAFRDAAQLRRRAGFLRPGASGTTPASAASCCSAPPTSGRSAW